MTNTGKLQQNPGSKIILWKLLRPKQVEEISTEKPLLTKTDDVTDNLVSFLVKNVGKLFGDLEETTMHLKPTINSDETTLVLRKTIATHSSNKEEDKFNLAIDENNFDTETEQAEQQNQASESIDSLNFFNSMPDKDQSSIRRSCIFCNNVAVMECYDPKNKLIPSNLCEREEDLCYSQHTPFGIVDRGCFNVNHNLSAYVCSCNLCNYISISEMPYLFSTKRDWVENVIELSRTRRLRRSVLKEMSCLRCEVNVSTETGDMLDNANCLEGNVGTLPIQVCSENEICGVKAIRSEGYIWRGCVAKPLYNYWWTLCDSDLCNYDSLVSVYDELQI
nr:uncharacterized protein LOC117986695 [Maniola hyperantus]